ncbi:F-type H+-transporting ATPase subunit gamma [Clostridium acidisoli DSM 12555]|jgi:F-type H+-transporting ATPase subunit gamma|uniref:ATP synthase gamma chain n=1 Tax=Clostridium acidisoli DSM 12555 TaxID=1121291 RepID=A0A1W1XX65_9CLOT|nr:ATP synthase F1 subunit gamma [Clostridium acidisoli]SMC28131.1 F-type H+-transporting ATPase subunit gamma [Clostridium acidisoli DSM 12555]
MAGGLLVIKRRIKSVTSTKKITNAMGLIATSKLRKCRINLESNQGYYNSFESIMKSVAEGIVGKSIYVQGNGSNKKLYITLSSDSGLCGGFNAAVVTATVEKASTDRPNSIIMSVGQKGRGYFRRLKYDTVAEYVDIPDEPTLKEAKTISEHALDLYKNGEVGEVHVVYTKFKSTVKQTVVDQLVLPLKVDKKSGSAGEFEPEANELLEGVESVYLKSQIFNFLLNSKASEQAARMSSMDSSTKNANDLLDALNLRYNRIRQSAITSEITEIVSGAQAQE